MSVASRSGPGNNVQGCDVAQRGTRFILVVLALTSFHFMLQLITILNRCHRFPRFVYRQARFQFRSQEH